VLNDEQEIFLERSMHEILPWCMAQHFSVRLYAQVIAVPHCIYLHLFFVIGFTNMAVTKWKSVVKHSKFSTYYYLFVIGLGFHLLQI
jgi:hypothetical protein